MIYSLKYTDDMPANQGGYAKAWLIRIRPRYKDDKGIHAHEICHVSQFWKFGIFHLGLYMWNKAYRLKCEVAAYREQLKYTPAKSNPGYYRDVYAGLIADNYGLDVSKGEVLKLLTQQ